MRILVACEESQAVTIAFRNKGHEAYSCDLQECSGGHPEWHLQMDCRKVIGKKWDLVIGHPPCPRLTNTAIWYIKRYNLWHEVDAAASFFNLIRNCKSRKVCVENPIPHGYAIEKIGAKYCQIIQPYNFNENASKATCLWLKGLPKLVNTGYTPPPE